nr:aldo/keto reductase [Neoroseomonas alba]
MLDIAAARGVKSMQVSLDWLLSKAVMAAPVVGVSDPSQIGHAAAAVDIILTIEEAADGSAARSANCGVAKRSRGQAPHPLTARATVCRRRCIGLNIAGFEQRFNAWVAGVTASGTTSRFASWPGAGRRPRAQTLRRR